MDSRTSKEHMDVSKDLFSLDLVSLQLPPLIVGTKRQKERRCSELKCFSKPTSSTHDCVKSLSSSINEIMHVSVGNKDVPSFRQDATVSAATSFSSPQSTASDLSFASPEHKKQKDAHSPLFTPGSQCHSILAVSRHRTPLSDDLWEEEDEEEEQETFLDCDLEAASEKAGGSIHSSWWLNQNTTPLTVAEEEFQSNTPVGYSEFEDIVHSEVVEWEEGTYVISWTARGDYSVDDISARCSDTFTPDEGAIEMDIPLYYDAAALSPSSARSFFAVDISPLGGMEETEPSRGPWEARRAKLLGAKCGTPRRS